MIGSSKSLQYTAIGDPMNVAARLQSLAKPGEDHRSEDTSSISAIGSRPADAAGRLRGRSKRIAASGIVGMRGSGMATARPSRRKVLI